MNDIIHSIRESWIRTPKRPDSVQKALFPHSWHGNTTSLPTLCRAGSLLFFQVVHNFFRLGDSIYLIIGSHHTPSQFFRQRINIFVRDDRETI